MTTTQAHREISVSCTLGADVLLFRRMHASEGLSMLSEYNLELCSERGDLNIDELLATPASVSINLHGGGQRQFSGLITRFALTGHQGRYALYEATLRPWLWLLTRSSNCRIFQAMSVTDIVKAVFESYIVADVDARGLSNSYPALGYCVQYRETDFNFISRLLEQAGIYYYFKSSPGRHTLMLVDSSAAHAVAPADAPLRYLGASDDATRDNEVIYDWCMSGEIESGAYVLQDFDFEKPSANLLVKSALTQPYGQSRHERYDYPGKYQERKQGEYYARSRLTALHTQCQQVQGTTRARTLFPGALVTLTGHPRSEQNTSMLVVVATYVLASDAYEPCPSTEPVAPLVCTFRALPSRHDYRPACSARKPYVHGPQTAIVVGRPGEEIWTDKYGRVKVQFHWDRTGQADENSSCWVRVSQAWAGKRWGTFSLPRIGQEVVVSFLEGDPDQPLVTGSVYNANCMPPYSLPEHATRSTMKSHSSKGGHGYNEVRFEDKKGAEQLYVHAERNLEQRIKQDALEWIGGERHIKVTSHLLEHVGGDRHSTVGGDRNENITGSVSLVAGDNMIIDSSMKCGVSAGMDVHIKAGMNVVIEAGSSITLKAGGAFMTLGPAIITSTIPLPLPAASAVAVAMALAASAGPAGTARTPKEADDGKL